MKLNQLIAELTEQGVKLSAEGDQLRIHAPKGVITPDMRALLALHKRELVTLLHQSNVLNIDIPLLPISQTENLPLSFAQERLWFFSQMEPDNPIYNEPAALRLKGSLNVAALKKSLNKIIQRHEALRTNFTTVDGQAVQVIAENLTLNVSVVDLQELPPSEREITYQQLATVEIQRPFDLASSPLIRATLFKLAEVEYLLLLTIHHIIYDGWSFGIILKELATIYSAECNGLSPKLPSLPIQYKDFAVWHREWLFKEVFPSQFAYWKQQLSGMPALLELPTDRPRPAVQTFRGGHQRFVVSQELTQALMNLSQQQEATLFVMLLAAFKIFLYRYTGQTDICVGTANANRDRSEIESLIGFFVNTIVLRTDISGNLSFKEILSRVREVTLLASAHQDLPFEKLVKELQPVRSLSHTPLVQVMLLLNMPTPEIQMAGLVVTLLEVESAIAKFDLTLSMENTAAGLVGVWEYNTDLFDASTLERMAGHFVTLLESIVANPKERISQLPMLTQVEQHQLLVEWNNTQADYPQDKCIHQLFEEQVERTPDAVAVVFENQQLTYHQLNCRANQLAHYLQSLGVKPDVLVGICVERSLEMVVGLLGILKAGGAYVPLDPDYPQDRLSFMLEDAQVLLLLTQQHITESLPEHQAKLVCLDEVWEQIAQNNQDNPTSRVRAFHLANLIYTSGSTGRPKGVMVEHRGLCNLAQAQIQTFGVDYDSRILQFASLSFDASIWEVAMAWGSGATLYLGTKDSLMPGIPLIERLRDDAITHITLPPSALAVLPTEELPALQTMIVAGEACSVELIKKWSVGRNFFNAYGPTEASVCATIAKCTEDHEKISIGRAIANTQVYILDKNLQPVPVGIPGELHIGGAGLARGYLNRLELTQEKFISHPFSNEAHSRLYKTGDLARYLPDGNIEYLGRIDNQVKIRGFRIELGEIEAALSQHPSVHSAIATARVDTPGEQRLVAYIVPEEDCVPTISELRQFLKAKLPPYMLPNEIAILESLPLTPNGKVDRHALPAPELDPDLLDQFVAPRTPIEKTLALIWVQVLKVEQVGIHNNFFELGGHSLLATQIISRLPSAFGISLPLRSLFESPTVAQLSEVISSQLENGTGLIVPEIVPVSRDTNIPLSWAQERLWFMHQLEGESGAYTMPFAMRLVGNLNVQALSEALRELVQRHEVLRTRFEIKDNLPVQAIAPQIPITLPVMDLQNQPDPEKLVEQLVLKESKKPFDLANGPVLRVNLWQVAQKEYVLLLAIHHIAADGWSMGVLIRELSAYYRGISTGSSVVLAKLPVQYADFSVWQRQWLTDKVLERQLSYWKQHLTGAPPLLELPTDRPRPAIQTFRGGTERFQLDSKVTDQLRKLSQESGSTLFMTLLAGFVVLLSRYSGQTDLVVGSPIANRNRREIEGLIGFFVNTLALRFDLSAQPTFEALLKQVRQVTQDAFDHQDLPFEMLVKELQQERNLDRNPLVQVVFALQNAATSSWDLPGLRVEDVPWEFDSVRVDLEVHLGETPEGIEGIFCYNKDLFDAATIARMMQHFANLLEAIVANPQQPVALLPLLNQQERNQLLVEWNDTLVDYSQDLCIHQLFEEQVQLTPDAVAVVFEKEQLTYHELNCRANQLAHYLQSLGVGADVLVGLCVERSPLMVIGLLAILKAGGAYVPLDPEYPSERLGFMLEDTQVPVLLTQQHLVDKLPQNQSKLVFIDEIWLEISQNQRDNVTSEVTASHLANVIYTSGSTGKPKGVMVEHRGLCNLAQAQIQTFGVDSSSRVLQFASLSFDACIWEVIMALRTGAALYLGTKDSIMPGIPLIERLRDDAITHVTLPPSALAVLPTEELPKLQTIIVAGEAISAELIKKWSVGRNFFNAYGPTEASVCATVAKCNFEDEKITIGRPIANTQIYILDLHEKPVPIGVPGELHVGGAGLARGYLNRLSLTQEKFISHPFSDEAHSRLYKTGDLARYLPDGNIEYLGRIDNQVKIRGFRIELGEIEGVLTQHPLVQEGVAVARVDNTGDKQLVAYLVPALRNKVLPQQLTQWQSEYVTDWQMLYEQAYGQPQASTDDVTFNISGWNSSYTKQPIPDCEMREWVENTVSRILSVSPQRVLEIGCGTGLLLSRVAPNCLEYWGCDYSSAAIAHVEQACKTVAGLNNVRLLHQMADNFADIPKGKFDTVVINSVVQYFPSVEYLLQVLEGAIATLGSQGTLFIGDVRSLPLLEPYHAAVQLSQAPEERTIEQWQRVVHSSVSAEEELVIDPSFFIALQKRFPQITWVEIVPKRGYSENELTQFRYDVTVHIGNDVSTAVVPWSNWQLDKLSLAQIKNQLHSQQPQVLGIRGVPNQRVQQAIQICQWLENPPDVETVGQLRQLLTQRSTVGINPEEFYQLGQQLGYTVHTSWWGSSQDGSYDVVLCRNQGQKAVFWDSSTVTTKAWTDYTNNPLYGKLVQKLVPQVRSHIQQKLPNYMVPQAFVLLNALPLTPNGKVDRRALPAPDTATRSLATSFVSPRTPTEAQLVQIWSEVLGVERIGVKDNFFELGGHSLLATQVISRLPAAFGISLPLRSLFESPTIAQLSEVISSELQTGLGLTVPEIVRVSTTQDIPLSWAQERLWFMHQLEGDSSAYTMPFAMRLVGNFNVKALSEALRELVQRHEVLRTRFEIKYNFPVQVIAPNIIITLPVVDLQNEPDSEKLVEQLALQESKKLFNLATGPVLRVNLWQVAQQEYVLLLAIHHIAGDGWSMAVLIRELSAYYRGISTGSSVSLPELPVQYADFAVWQRQWLTDKVLERQLSYWKQHLTGAPPLLELPTDRPRPAIQTFRGGTEQFQLDSKVTDQLRKLSQESGSTLFMTLLAGFVVLLSRYSGQTDLVVGSPIANRNRREIEGLIGFFVNTLALRFDLSAQPTFEALLKQVRQVTQDAFDHQDLPFEMLVKELQQERNLDRNPLVQVVFALQNAATSSWDLPGLRVEDVPWEFDSVRVDLEVHLGETPEGIEGIFCYNKDLFDAATIARMMQHFANLLEAIVANPQQPVALLPLLNQQERNQLLVEWNDTLVDYSQDLCIHQLFEEQVQLTPDAVAVVFEKEQLTYHELNCRANQLAHYLQSLGVGADVLVGLCVERSPLMVIGLLAILKAGGAYVPLDPEYPSERLGFMLEDTQVPVLLTQQHLVDKLPQNQSKLVFIDEIWLEISQNQRDNVTSEVTASHLANVIYTSGSTGKPKGVMVEHRGLCNLAQAQIQTFGVDSSSRVLQFASLSFDACIWEVIMALRTGAALYLGTKDSIMPGIPLIERLRDDAITHVTLPPSALAVLPTEELPKLQTIIVAGEAISAELIKKWSVGRNFFNAYGPTEASVCATVAKCNFEDEKITIGRPIANTQIYILDLHEKPVPIGVPGELHVGGAGLARGYLNRLSLTQEKFISHPFSDEAHSRLYKTGDLARYLPDGNIEYLGRIDNQVKIRGFRIELGEIEAVLSQHPSVHSAIATARVDTPGEQRLVAYIVPQEDCATTISELRQFLKTKLPPYMVPNAIVILESLPLTPNGKIDRRALPAPELDRQILDKFAAPRNPIEEKLALIWAEVLKVEQVGIHNNFFELGGHSLLAVRLMSRIQQQFRKNLPLTTLFQNGTVEQLATILRQETISQTKSPLIPIQPTGSKPPLFCIHPIGGNVLCYADLARNLGSEQPVYGLQALGLNEQEEPLKSIEDMATAYIEAIQVIQPTGPYYLSGWSMGGIIAFEMAQQLLAKRYEVALLALIDSYVPTLISPISGEGDAFGNVFDERTLPSLEELDDATEVAYEFLNDIAGISNQEISLSKEELRYLKQEKLLAYILDWVKTANVLPPEFGEQQIHSLFRLFHVNRQALFRYLPQPYSGRTVFLPADKTTVEDSGWGKVISSLEEQMIPADHYTLLKSTILAHKLSNYLT
jgi:amino acid adenylation domain-containing protein